MRTLTTPALALAMAALLGCSPALKKDLAHPAPASVAVAETTTSAAPVAAADLVAMEVAPANRYVKAAEPGEMLVRIRLGARALKDAPRPPINLALVVDTSGSMANDGIEDARRASLALLDALSPGDSLAVVAFHSRAEVLAPSTRLDERSIETVRARIGKMAAHGTTDMAAGLQAGLDEVMRGFRPDGINRIVLVGDGVPNNEAPILPLAQSAGRSAVPVTVLGLGLDYNETLMNAVAQHSGGKFHFLRESSEVASVFKDEVLRLKRVVGRSAALRLAPGPGVLIKGVLGLPAQAVGTETHVTLGDLSEGDQRDVIVRVSTGAHRPGSMVELLDAVLSFDGSAAGAGRLEERGFVAVKATAEPSELVLGKDPDVELSAARMTVADRIVQAIATARAGQIPQAQAMLDQVEKEAKRAAKQFDDAELRDKAKSIPALRESLPSLAKQPEPTAQVHPGRPAMKPAAAAEAAEVVMASQASAVRTIQGL